MKHSRHWIIYLLPIVCVLIIFLVGNFFLSSRQPTNSVRQSKEYVIPTNQEVALLQKENERLRKQVERLGNTATTKGVDSSKMNLSAISEGNEKIPAMADLQKLIHIQQQAQAERKINLKLESLKKHLNLREDQVSKIRRMMNAQSLSKSNNLSRLLELSGSKTRGKDALAIVNSLLTPDKNDGAFNTDLANLLDEDQKNAYEEYLVTQRTNRVEAMANKDLATLQSMFELTDDQKDLAFNTFADLARQNLEPNGAEAGILDAQQIFKKREQKLTALKPILTSEQMEVYRNSPAANTAELLGFGHNLDGATIIGTSITIDSPLEINSSRREK